MTATPLNLTGMVVRQLVNEGSKSERNAIVLEANDGRSYVLREQGKPAFSEQGLSPLVGKSIEARGIGVGSTLILRDWSPAN